MKIKIAKVMKQISRYKGEINLIEDRIKKSISVPEVNEYPEDFVSLTTLRNEKVRELITLKCKVMQKNIESGMFVIITTVSELKNEIVLYKDFEIKQGIVKNRYDENAGLMHKTQITVAECEKHISELQTGINDYTDELDAFNAITEIEI